MDRREVGQFDHLRAGPGAIPFAELDLAPEHAAAAIVRHDVHDPLGGGLDDQRRQALHGPIEIELRLVALAPLGHHVGVGAGPVGSRLLLRFLPFLFGVGDRQLRLLEFELRHEIPLAEVELRAIELVLRAHHRGVVLLQRDALLRLHLRDLRVGLLQLGLLLLHALAKRGAVELHQHVAHLHRAAVLGELDDLQLPCLHRRGQDDRLRRADLAADLQVVDKLPLGHVHGGHVGHRAGAGRHGEAADRDHRDRRHQHEGSGTKELHRITPRLTLRAMTDPSERPPATTISCVFCVPTEMSRRSNPLPFCTWT